MNILISCEDFRTGGAQVFALRLADALRNMHNIYLYSHHHKHIIPELVYKIAPNLPVLSYKSSLDFFFYKFDGLLKRLRIDFSIRDLLVARHIRKTVKKYKINLVHSHMFKADYVCGVALKNSQIPLVITMHGNYESFLWNYEHNKNEVIVNYPKKLRKALLSIKGIAYLTSKNLDSLKRRDILSESDEKKIIIKKIYNGFTGFFSNTATITRASLGISDSAIVFCMVARGHVLKGWQQAIDAFIPISHQNTHLVLVGDSEYMNSLKEKYDSNKKIHFVGFSDNPLDIVRFSDVGLMPSLFKESLPNTIVEYLFCGKPVIATNTGEAKEMIDYMGEKAGFLLEISNEKIDTLLFTKYLNSYLFDKELLEKHSNLALKAFQKFKLEKCINEYNLLYKEVLQ